jgi:hypothetical protein
MGLIHGRDMGFLFPDYQQKDPEAHPKGTKEEDLP